MNDVTIHYEERGSGEPILLIMGLATQMIAWPPQFLDALVERGYRVIRFDNRDIGLSTKTDAPAPDPRQVLRALAGKRFAKSDYLLENMAEDTVGLLDHLGIDRAHVVGVSMGGMIAQEVAIRHPERVATLTSIMSNTGNRRGRPSAAFLPELSRSLMTPRPTEPDGAIDVGVRAWRLISGPHFNEEEVRAMVVEAVARDTDPHGRVRQTMAILASPDRTPRLRRLAMPTLVIHGLLDKLVSPSGGIATARAIPGSRLLMFPDMAHDLPRPRIPEIVDAIVANATRRSVTDAAAAAGPGEPPSRADESAEVGADHATHPPGISA